MEDERVHQPEVIEVTPSVSGPGVGKGCALIFGGAALGFFGCLGAISAQSDNLIFVALALGAAVMVWGAIVFIAALWRSMSKPLGKP